MTTVTIEEARKRVGALTKIRYTGKTLVLFGNKGSATFKSASPKKRAIRVRPAGYFDDLYTDAEAAESNRFATKSPLASETIRP